MELLVVIAIIGILSGIVLAAVSAARTKASVAGAQSFAANLDRTYGAYSNGTWDFEDGSGTSVADTSGVGNTGSITGTYTWVSGMSGGGLMLGTDGAVTFPANSNYTTQTFTIAFWLKPGGLAGSTGQWSNIMLTAGVYNTNGFRFGMAPDGTLTFWDTESGGSLALTSSKSINSDRFYHIAISYNGTKANMYIDGRIVASATGTYVSPNSLGLNTNVGFGHPNTMTYDSLRFYGASLLSSQIQDLYQEGLYKHSSLAVK